MGLFDFLRPQKNFEREVNQLEGMTIAEKQHIKVIEIKHDVSFEEVKQLLKILRKHKVAFAIYDIFYHSYTDSDPGAYISYSQEKNDWENAWSMTLGNHGWSGGIYTIEERNIVLQIFNLIKKKQIDTIRINKAGIFSHYNNQGLDRNRNENAWIYSVHSDISRFEPKYLIFGLFWSDNHGTNNIYKLTPERLFVDGSGSWQSDRFNQKGYIFKGKELSKDKFDIAQSLLTEIPIELMNQKWPGFYTTVNKNEDKLILEFKTNDFHRTITIDSY